MPKININGVTREMTMEEQAAYEAEIAALSPPVLSDSERIAALEEQLKAAKILLGVE